MLMTDIHVRAFSGSALRTYVHSIAKLRMDVFQEYPFFEVPDLYKEMHCLQRYTSSKEAIGVLVFDHSTVVGVSLGIPLLLERSEIQEPIRSRFGDITSYYFFGESLLLKPYRNRGVGHHFFDVREAHVAHFQKYRHICFLDPLRPEIDALKPPDCLSLHDFWRKRGYAHYPDLCCHLSWKDLHTKCITEKTLTFWINTNPRK